MPVHDNIKAKITTTANLYFIALLPNYKIKEQVKYLKEEMFHAAWNEFKDRSFNADFEVKSFFLLKHNGKFWEILQEMPFTE